ncbi:G-type lectin S-receptor-like serine/threonine-protein kinase LECRK3 [Humulus lupulus]|uniref:G-type lectin S-receptor-like serine/threonine-protein kinase LECRK3 n=1 Tax=Humulus lupulus TaxID=3486 RepID=UPI002B416791|nr:G-type lectin S-receptor-like serine/threonine-protein kinase LECRK3 [Humulus lupulus]
MSSNTNISTSLQTFLSLFLLVLLSYTSRTSGDQTRRNITLGSSLTAQLNQNEQSSWQSPSGDFAFGFQQIQKDGFLLALWFNKIPQKTIVWSANRDHLVQQGSTVELTKLGSLVLRDSTGKQVWSRAVVSGSGVSHAAMLDIGNFVLANQNHAKLWESFNEPTDTLLPTQILSHGKELAASHSESDYSRGRYYFKVHNGNLVFYVRRFTKPSSDISYWPENQAPGNGTQVMFNQSGSFYLQAQNGTITEWLTQSDSDFSKGFYQRAILEYDGVFSRYVYPKDDENGTNSRGWPSGKWSRISPSIPQNMCISKNVNRGSGACGYNSYCRLEDGFRPNCLCLDGYTFIDPNDKAKGCIPKFEAQSCHEDLEDFKNFDIYSMENTNWPEGDYDLFESVSEDWCRRACLVDCFCALAIYGGDTCWKKRTPFSNGIVDSNVNVKTLFKIRKNSTTATAKPSNNTESKPKDQTTLTVIGSVLLSSSALLNIILLTTSLVFFSRLRRRASIAGSYQTMPETNLQNFTYSELEKATNGFKEQLGVGGFGAVFKGVLALGKSSYSVAVKRLDNMVKEGEQEFKAEVMSIGRTNHKNLVKLIGFCNQGQHRLLVYEYMSNGSLASFLFGSSNKPRWHQRMQIALGIARGLFYLHEECSTQIIHCDIKPQNILLDESYTARISDFGLAKILKTDQTRTNTGIRGTKGYVAPEWFRNMAVSVKVDVYSYGILLLELICCRKNVEVNVKDDARMILADWACDCYGDGKVECLVENDDEAVMELKMVEKYVMVAIWCIQEDPSLRPTMKKVMLMLEGSVKFQAPPHPNSFLSSL